MTIIKKLVKITSLNFFVIILIFFSTLQAKNYDKYEKAKYISDYISGTILFNQSNYDDSYKYLKKLDGLEKNHPAYSSKYIYSLVNSGNFNQALNFSKKISKSQKGNFESDLIIGLYYLKNSKFDTSKKYFLSAKNRNSRSILDYYIAKTLYIWSDLNKDDLASAKSKLNQLDERFQSLKKIQNVFINCYFEGTNTKTLFEELTTDQKTDFSRYNYFFAQYMYSANKKKAARDILEKSLIRFPRNLLINQYKIDLDNSENNLKFDCKQEKDVIAEIFYIAANALSSQSMYSLSNFYLNLSKYLNKEFHAFNVLLAENFYKIEDFPKAKKIYNELTNYGSAFKWHSSKLVSRILIIENNKVESLKYLEKAYNSLPVKGIYQTFDYAEFLKNNEEFAKAIKYYSKILDKIDESHPLFPEVTDGRGVSYERAGEWENAEKDLIASLKVSPNQAYVINYLAYSWIEQGIKIEKSLEMLEKANKLKSNDPFIIDSLGWALFKLKRYKEAKDYLQLAVMLMPADPIVNDHFGDVLWQNGNEIQARYYWNYVLSLEKAEKDLKAKIEQKLIKGL